jgi:hypothetical protein
MLDSYDGTFTSTYSIPRTITQTGSAPYQWARTITGTQGFTDTLWSVQGGQGSGLHAGIDTYTNGVTTTVTYGPINLQYAISTAIAFSHWISVADGDGLEWGYSTDGATFTFLQVPPIAAGTWETTTAVSDQSAHIAKLAGQRAAYLALRFHSNDDNQVDLGVFLNDVQLWARYHAEAFLPFVTLPVEPYVDDFGDPTSGWPREWVRKEKNVNNRGGYMIDRHRAQLYSELMQKLDPLALDDKPQAWFPELEVDMYDPAVRATWEETYYSVVHDAWDQVFISGPFQAEGDFRFEAEGTYTYVQKEYDGNRYGILVTEERVNPENPHSIHGYCVYVEPDYMTGGGFHKAKYALKQWYQTDWKGDDNGDIDRTVTDGDDSVIKSDLGDRNRFRFERQGDRLHFWINDKYFGYADDVYTGPMYIGFFARHTGSGATELSYDIVFEWDDVLVEPLY